ncbi:MAG TPA: metallophosphoesterase, partial [Terricaulis sp.]|nr:metallophosphoesterase [Terricaulis sp.]
QFFFAQISDTHVRADDGGAAAAAMQRAMAEAARYGVQAILMTGDLVNDAREDEYAVLAEALAAAPAPVFLMPGNHDSREGLRATFPTHDYLPKEGALSYTIERFPVRIVMLDQTVPGEVHGDISPEQAAWLHDTLAAAPERPTVVALHHPPFATHDLLFDTIGLRHGEAFNVVIARHRQVARVICGHHHRFAVGQAGHAPVIVAPSTSWAYGLAMRQGDEIAPRTEEQPGWVLHAWTARGGLASHFIGL